MAIYVTVSGTPEGQTEEIEFDRSPQVPTDDMDLATGFLSHALATRSIMIILDAISGGHWTIEDAEAMADAAEKVESEKLREIEIVLPSDGTHIYRLIEV